MVYFSLGIVPYHDRWCHPSRLSWVQGMLVHPHPIKPTMKAPGTKRFEAIR